MYLQILLNEKIVKNCFYICFRIFRNFLDQNTNLATFAEEGWGRCAGR